MNFTILLQLFREPSGYYNLQCILNFDFQVNQLLFRNQDNKSRRWIGRSRDKDIYQIFPCLLSRILNHGTRCETQSVDSFSWILNKDNTFQLFCLRYEDCLCRFLNPDINRSDNGYPPQLVFGKLYDAVPKGESS